MVLNYFFIGFAFIFLLDLILIRLHKNPIMKEVVKRWGWKERVACVLVWPIAALVFSLSFVISHFKK